MSSLALSTTASFDFHSWASVLAFDLVVLTPGLEFIWARFDDRLDSSDIGVFAAIWFGSFETAKSLAIE